MQAALLEQALELPPSDRVEFAETILASIDYEDESIRQEWITEVKARMQSVREGRSTLLDYDAVLGR